MPRLLEEVEWLLPTHSDAIRDANTKKIGTADPAGRRHLAGAHVPTGTESRGALAVPVEDSLSIDGIKYWMQPRSAAPESQSFCRS